MTGRFADTVDFGGPSPLVSAGSYDVFVAKYDSGGLHLWSRRFGDLNRDTNWSLAIDDAGNVFVTGYFEGTADLGGGNPFNPSRALEVALPEAGHVVLRIYDIRGRLLTSLLDEHLKAGYPSVSWDGRDAHARPVPSGVYIYGLDAGHRTLSKKVTLAR